MTIPGREDLRTYAAIGDGRTVALIAADGGIDWMPMPNLDSAPVFARIVDDADGGCIELAPDGEYTVRRRYLPGTNVLQTTFTTPGGVATVTDALVTGVAGRLPWAQLVRRIAGMRGEVRFRWAVRPGTRLRTAAPWIKKHDGVHLLQVGSTMLAVIGSEVGRPRADATSSLLSAVRGTFTTAADSTHILAIIANDDEPLHLADPGLMGASLDRSIAGWRDWSKEFSYDGPWQDAVQRSALALKLLVYAPTGAIAAAATTSLPENPAGGKNWDYRFAWVRDLAYTAHALVRFGLREETHAALSWMVKTIRADGDLRVMYTLRGEPVEGVEFFDAPGWAGIGPVVTGNPASDQLQLGVYGDLFAICRTYADAGNVLDPGTGRLLAELADRVCDLWRNRDSGMWELPELAHYTSSKMGCWQALRDAVHLPPPTAPWSGGRWSGTGSSRGSPRSAGRRISARTSWRPDRPRSTPRCCCTPRAVSIAANGCRGRSTRSPRSSEPGRCSTGTRAWSARSTRSWHPPSGVPERSRASDGTTRRSPRWTSSSRCRTTSASTAR